MSDVLTVSIDSLLDEVPGLCDRVVEFMAVHSVQPRTSSAVQLVVEETVVNTIKYGYDDASSGHEITVSLEMEPDEIVVSIEDDGLAFDPTAAASDAPGGPLEARTPGGLGLILLQRMSASLIYRRVDDHNLLEARVPR